MSNEPESQTSIGPDHLTAKPGFFLAQVVGCMIALPGQLFYTTQIPVCIWFLTKNKKAQATIKVVPTAPEVRLAA